MTKRKRTGQGGADAVARNADAAQQGEVSRRGQPPASARFAEEDESARTRPHRGGKQAEALAAQETRDSNFGKGKYPVRPTPEERASGVPGADNVPLEAEGQPASGEVINRGFSTESPEAHTRPRNPLAEHPKTTT